MVNIASKTALNNALDSVDNPNVNEKLVHPKSKTAVWHFQLSP
jgi:hypothetical protein